MQRYTGYFIWKLLYMWYHHASSGAQTTVCTASGICYTVTAICRYRGRVGTGFDCAVGGVRHSQHTQNQLGFRLIT